MSITMQPVESTQIMAIGHDEESKTLAIQFKGGSVYHYQNVPVSLFAELMAAESKGKFFGQNLKNAVDKYPFHKQPKTV